MPLEIRKDWNYQTGKQDYLICEKEGPWLFKTDNEYRAAFIVRAVNNFDQMLLALKKLEDRTIETSFAHQIAKEAIAKAEGKE